MGFQGRATPRAGLEAEVQATACRSVSGPVLEIRTDPHEVYRPRGGRGARPLIAVTQTVHRRNAYTEMVITLPVEELRDHQMVGTLSGLRGIFFRTRCP